MLRIQVTSFRRIVEPGNLEAGIVEVNADANAFLATIPAIDVGEVQTQTTLAGKYGERLMHMVSVYYVKDV